MGALLLRLALWGLRGAILYGGVAVAAVISYQRWGSWPWALLHAGFGWLYVLYAAIQGNCS